MFQVPQKSSPTKTSVHYNTSRGQGGWARVHWLVGIAALASVIGTAFLIWNPAGRSSGDPALAMAQGKYARAVRWLEPEVKAGNPQARTVLGNLYYLGLGVPRNARRAAELYHAAAKSGYAAAQVNLGNLYRQGIGVNADASRAYGWYRQADIHGSPAAEYYLYQISVEYTLSPLQQATANERWDRLEQLVAEPL